MWHKFNEVSYAKVVWRLGLSFLCSIAPFAYMQDSVWSYLLKPFKWSSTSVQYDTHTFSGTWNQVASDSKQPWNNVSPSPFTFSQNNSSANDVYLAYIDGVGGTQAFTGYVCSPSCVAGASIIRATIRFDSGESWYTDSACVVPSTSFDSRSIGTHEFGHAAGLGHSSASGNPTMYAYSSLGTCHLRSLETDDQNGLNAQYP